METVTIDITCKSKAANQVINQSGVNIYRYNGIDPTIKEGECVIRIKNIDEVLYESLTIKELVEYYGIDAENYISHEEVV